MAARGKSINLFLMDGTATGRVKCTLANWTGVAYRIPRTDLDKCREREDLSQSGVYFLFGVSEQSDKNVVYIGQAGARKNGEGILYRLQEHKRNIEKDYWTEAVVFTTSNNSFGPTEISYLENRFCVLSTAANRYIVKNGNEPTIGNVTEEKESELEEFLEYAQIVMGALGHKVMEPLADRPILSSSVQSIIETETLVLYLKKKSRKNNIEVEASCLRTAEGFVVKTGSYIEDDSSDTISSGIKEMRKNALLNAERILQEDLLFKSPSSAASFVIGRSANGYLEWKTLDGKTLKEVESSEAGDV